MSRSHQLGRVAVTRICVYDIAFTSLMILL